MWRSLEMLVEFRHKALLLELFWPTAQVRAARDLRVVGLAEFHVKDRAQRNKFLNVHRLG